MGCDIHIVAQRKVGDLWVEVEGQFEQGPSPFDWRSYGMFGFLAGVRNYSQAPVIAQPRGLPSDYDSETSWGTGGPTSDEHSCSWLTVAELVAFDYDQTFEDLRITDRLENGVISGAVTGKPGEGETTTLRRFLGEGFFRDLARLENLGAERIVFGFDN